MTRAGNWFLFVFCALSLCLAGCQLKPTKARETPERKYEGSAKLVAPIQITPETVVIDARSPFEFSVAHVPHSLNLQWTDFTVHADRENRGVLQGDLGAIARRLARAGLTPSSHVVVVGKGSAGDGEEGRIAWMLAYLGFANVQFASLDSLKFRLTNIVEETPLKSGTPWKLETVDSLIVPRDELRHVMNHNGVNEPIAGKPGMKPVLYRIIDVRDADDYLGRRGFGAKNRIPNMGAINIPWKEFFDAALRPRPEMLAKLSSVGVRPEHRIIVVDAEGLASADVTMALRALGFPNSGLLAGGLADLLAAYQ